MSYRSIKSVLGETSLERKCRFLFGASLLVLITASFWLYGGETDQIVYQQNRNTGKLLMSQMLQMKHSALSEPTKTFRPLARHLTEMLSKYDCTFEFIVPRGNEPTRTMRAPQDDGERRLRDGFLHGRPQIPADADNPECAERPLPKEGRYEYYQPIVAFDVSCVDCHRAPVGGSGIDSIGTGMPLTGGVSNIPLSKGDIMAIAKVTIPTRATQKNISRNRAFLITTAIITVFLAMVTAYAIVRYVIVKPLRHLRDVADAISHGNIAQRADIHTGDEFEELAVAFNRMLRHLVASQDELRQVNTTLDGKVDELAQANMRLYEMNTIKSDFLATMSHELRTPLNSILGFSEVLDSIAALDEKQKRYVQNIQKSGRTLLEMINDILDLAKMESGKMDVRLSDFRVGQIVGAAMRHGPAADRKKEHRHGNGHRPGPPADAPGPGPNPANPQQPPLQRDQVHPRGRADHRQRRPRRRFPHPQGQRHGRGHCGGGSAGHL